MLSEPLQIEIESLSTPYKTCQHSLRNTMAKANSMTLAWERQQEGFNKDTYTVFDTIVSPTYELDINEYNNAISGTSINGSIPIAPLYRQIILLYCNYNGSEMARKDY